MPNQISVIIPSYRNPEYLDLCLKSLIENQTAEQEIIVVLDGYPEESEHVVNKYPGIGVLALDENKGVQYAHNVGVIYASNESILLLNDDNVAPREWDRRLLDVYNSNWVISPNQCEPSPSIFNDFFIRDFGKNVNEFEYEEFLKFEYEEFLKASTEISKSGKDDLWRESGQTWPVFMSKKWYMILGGCDEHYPNGAFADWDFFVRIQLAGLKTKRYLGCIFYHFASASVKKSPEIIAKQNEGELLSYQYFYWKWGYQPFRKSVNPNYLYKVADNNSRFPSNLNSIVRGIEFRSEE